MLQIGIGAAIYISNHTHFALAQNTVRSFVSAEHDLQWCFTANSPLSPQYNEWLLSVGHVQHNPENNVSMAWNRSIEYLLAQGCDYVIVPNLDIIAKSNMVDKLVAWAESHRDPLLWTAMPWPDEAGLEESVEQEEATETPHFSCFMVDHRLFDIVGPMDENIRPAYNEDLDMHYRINLSGNTAVGYHGARFYHVGSATIHNDPLLYLQNHRTHAANDEYFRKKWGYKPPTAADDFTKDMYKVPFNGNPPDGWSERLFINGNTDASSQNRDK